MKNKPQENKFFFFRGLKCVRIFLNKIYDSQPHFKIYNTPPEGAGKGVIEQHHQLPKQFKDKFEKAGLNIEDYTISLDKADHRLKPGGLHTGSENWNKQWKKFFDKNPSATKGDILKQLSKMRKAFGLE